MTETLLTNGTLELLLQIATLLATLFMSTALGEKLMGAFTKYKANRNKVAIRLLEAGVVYVFQYAYRELKEKTTTLNTADAARLRNLAIERAIQLSHDTYGKDIITKSLGTATLDSAVERIVQQVKTRGNIPT